MSGAPDGVREGSKVQRPEPCCREANKRLFLGEKSAYGGEALRLAPKTEAAMNLQISLVLEVPIPGATFPAPWVRKRAPAGPQGKRVGPGDPPLCPLPHLFAAVRGHRESGHWFRESGLQVSTAEEPCCVVFTAVSSSVLAGCNANCLVADTRSWEEVTLLINH